MNIIQLLKNYEKICLSFESKDEDELKKRLMILGYRIPEDFCSPVIIHRDGTLSFITGFVSGMFFNQPKEKLKEKGIIKVKYSELNPEDSFSAWYNSRKI